jgi:hypothetical protein
MWQLENKSPVENKNKERWQVLCERAAIEHDPSRLTAIIQELSAALEEKDRREKSTRPKTNLSRPSSQQPAK